MFAVCCTSLGRQFLYIRHVTLKMNNICCLGNRFEVYRWEYRQEIDRWESPWGIPRGIPWGIPCGYPCTTCLLLPCCFYKEFPGLLTTAAGQMTKLRRGTTPPHSLRERYQLYWTMTTSDWCTIQRTTTYIHPSVVGQQISMHSTLKEIGLAAELCPLLSFGVYLFRLLLFCLLLVSSTPFSSTPAILCQYLYVSHCQYFYVTRISCPKKMN